MLKLQSVVILYVLAICSRGLDVAELCASTPINVVEIVIFGRPLFLEEANGFDLLSESSDPVSDIPDILSKK